MENTPVGTTVNIHLQLYETQWDMTTVSPRSKCYVRRVEKKGTLQVIIAGSELRRSVAHNSSSNVCHCSSYKTRISKVLV